MDNQSAYKQQQNLSLAQFMAEVPNFVATLVSAILSRTVLVFVDLIESFGYLLRTGLVALLSKKLTKDLRYEYNYGVGKIEAIVSLICDTIEILGFLLTLGISVHSIIFPKPPSGFVIAVVGLKAINVGFDTAFFLKQRKILKLHNSAISEANYAAATAALMFDIVTMFSLLAVWLLRNNPIGGYISPVMSIMVAIYLMVECFGRIRASLDELTDKTLPEEMQMKILNILTRFYNSYDQIYSVNSHKIGEAVQIDLHLSFDKDTRYEEIVALRGQMQEELAKQIGKCTVNIIPGNV